MCSSVFADIGSISKVFTTNITEPTINTTGGDWVVIALARGGVEAEEYYNSYYKNAVATIKACGGVLSDRKYTEYARVTLAMTAIKKDASDIEGYNLVSKLLEYDNVIKQGINGSIFALIALDSGNYYSDNLDIRNKYLENILAKQHSDGGFGMGAESEVDVTSMALQALKKYKSREDVSACIDSALQYIQGANKYQTSEDTSQVIIALSALGIDSKTDSRFFAQGKSAYDTLMEYSSGNGFEHIKGGGYDQMATEQGLLAMVAYERFKNEKNSLYDMENYKGKIEIILKLLGGK